MRITEKMISGGTKMQNTIEELRQLQAAPLKIKIAMTRTRLMEWISHYGESGVYLSWSGGKDSTVLRHIMRKYWPDVESVFVNTGLEYPEIQQFVRAAKDRGEPVTILHPKMTFRDVILKYGYPVISKEVSGAVYESRRSIAKGNYETVRVKRMLGLLKNGESSSQYNHEKYKPLLDVDFFVSDRCCNVMKKAPAKKYAKSSGKVPITAQMASESRLRTSKWIQHGCNGFDMKSPISNPMSFWTEQDVLEYIKLYDVEIPSVYGEIQYAVEPEQMRLEEFTGDLCADKLCTTGCSQTGCIFCGFGAHLEKPGNERFLRLKETHPKQYAYCIGGGEYNEQGIWKPNKDGLGMGHVFDELNRLYGEDFIRYK